MPHKNDMTVWDEIGCQRGCLAHASRLVEASLGGPTLYHDYTTIPERFAQTFEMWVWDTSLTPVDNGPYCPARDAVSETILSHGVWEIQESAVLLNCFEAVGVDSWFVDYGSQIGWFSTLAARAGMQVLAYDADVACVDVTRLNLERNGDPGTFCVEQRRLDSMSPSEDYPSHLEMVVKIDIEGAERHAIRVLQQAIDARRVPYILMEVSPIFHEGYGDLTVGLIEDGYHVYQMPPKRQPPIQIETLRDLKPYQLVGGPNEVRSQVDSVLQQDLLFVMGGIE